MGDWKELSKEKQVAILTELEVFLCSDIQKGYSALSSTTRNDGIVETQRPDTCEDITNENSETEGQG